MKGSFAMENLDIVKALPLRSGTILLAVRDAGFAGLLFYPTHMGALPFRGSFVFGLTCFLICHSSNSLFDPRISKRFYRG